MQHVTAWTALIPSALTPVSRLSALAAAPLHALLHVLLEQIQMPACAQARALAQIYAPVEITLLATVRRVTRQDVRAKLPLLRHAQLLVDMPAFQADLLHKDALAVVMLPVDSRVAVAVRSSLSVLVNSASSSASTAAIAWRTPLTPPAMSASSLPQP